MPAHQSGPALMGIAYWDRAWLEFDEASLFDGEKLCAAAAQLVAEGALSDAALSDVCLFPSTARSSGGALAAPEGAAASASWFGTLLQRLPLLTDQRAVFTSACTASEQPLSSLSLLSLSLFLPSLLRILSPHFIHTHAHLPSPILSARAGFPPHTHCSQAHADFRCARVAREWRRTDHHHQRAAL